MKITLGYGFGHNLYNPENASCPVILNAKQHIKDVF